MRKKIQLTDIEKKVIEILEWEGRSMSIREIKLALEERYDLKRSPQIIKRLLFLLKKKKVIK